MKTLLTTLTILSAVFFAYGIGCFDALGTEDVAAPVLAGFSFTPATVDTSNGEQTITAAMNITDGLTGFQRGTLTLIPPNNGSQIKFVRFDAGQRTGGTANSGTYSVPASLPQYSQTGAWKIVSVELIDVVGNSNVYRMGNPALGNYSTVRTQ